MAWQTIFNVPTSAISEQPSQQYEVIHTAYPPGMQKPTVPGGNPTQGTDWKQEFNKLLPGGGIPDIAGGITEGAKNILIYAGFITMFIVLVYVLITGETRLKT